MKNIFYICLITILFVRCSEDKNNSKLNSDDNINQLEIAGDGGEIDINKITHGDKPIWLDLIEMDDLEHLDKVLGNKDTLSLSQLTYLGLSVWDMKLNQLVSRFDLQQKSVNSEISFWVKDSLKLNFKKDTLNSLSDLDISKLKLYDKKITEYKVDYFKNQFPKSYSLRNYYLDSYQLNFAENGPKSYDHIILVAGENNMYFHFYFVNKKVVDFVFNDEKGF